MLELLVVVVGVLTVVFAVACLRRVRSVRTDPASVRGTDGATTVRRDDLGIAHDAEGFVLELAGPASLAAASIPLRGRLQVFVPRGSQYAIWRQFPGTVQYELELPSGRTATTIDVSMSISEHSSIHESYARRPADRIVGETFEKNVFTAVERLVVGAGRYRLRAHYQQWTSNWVEVELLP